MAEQNPILIAEDNDDDFFFFRRAVRAAQIENPLLRFRDGSEFVRFAEKITPPDPAGLPWLFFVDISMPIMNGFEVLAWLQKHKFHAAPIVLSGSHREEDITRSLALGAKDYLVKPIAPARLAALAAEHLPPLPASAT